MSTLNRGLLSDTAILSLCYTHDMITPYEESQVRKAEDNPLISYGLSSYGYDCRLDQSEFKVFSPANACDVDPKNFDKNCLIDVRLKTAEDGSYYWLLPPNTYALGITHETFNMPENVTALAIGKSTYARCGLVINTTPLEAGWRGRLVVELFNATTLPLRVYAMEGIAQILFFAGEPCKTNYADRAGKYQDQAALTLAKV